MTLTHTHTGRSLVNYAGQLIVFLCVCVFGSPKNYAYSFLLQWALLCFVFRPLRGSKDHTTWTARTRSRRARCQRPFKTFLKKALSPPRSGNVCEASADQLSLGVLARVTCVPCAAMRSERVTREKRGGVDQGTPKSSILVGFSIINK